MGFHAFLEAAGKVRGPLFLLGFFLGYFLAQVPLSPGLWAFAAEIPEGLRERRLLSVTEPGRDLRYRKPVVGKQLAGSIDASPARIGGEPFARFSFENCAEL